MKILLATIITVGTTSACFGQGFVDFHNTQNTRISTNGFLQAAAPVGTWYYALLVAPSNQNTIGTNDGSFMGWTFVTLGTNTTTAGRMSGNTTTDGLGVQVPGYSSLATVDFAVVGWSANLGTDFNTVRAGFHGFDNYGTWNTSPFLGAGWFGISTVAQDIPLAPDGGPYNTVFGSASRRPRSRPLFLGRNQVSEPHRQWWCFR